MGRLGSLTLIWQLVLEKENSKFKPVKLCLKINIVSHPACVKGLGKYIHESRSTSLLPKKVISWILIQNFHSIGLRAVTRKEIMLKKQYLLNRINRKFHHYGTDVLTTCLSALTRKTNSHITCSCFVLFLCKGQGQCLKTFQSWACENVFVSCWLRRLVSFLHTSYF